MGSYKGAWTAHRACEEDNATALQGAAAPAAVTSAVRMSRAAPVGNAVRLRSERRVVGLGFCQRAHEASKTSLQSPGGLWMFLCAGRSGDVSNAVFEIGDPTPVRGIGRSSSGPRLSVRAAWPVLTLRVVSV